MLVDIAYDNYSYFGYLAGKLITTYPVPGTN